MRISRNHRTTGASAHAGETAAAGLAWGTRVLRAAVAGLAWVALTTAANAQFCTSDPECDDQQVCNGMETCDTPSMMCLQGSPIVCNDGNPCTLNICQEPAGSCNFIATPDAETSAGSDGLCNTGDDNLGLFGADGDCGTMDDATGDGICALQDNCGAAHNPAQEDADRDAAGDACDPTPCLVRGLYALSGVSLFRVDPVSGAATFVASGFSDAKDVAVDATETKAVVTGRASNMLWVVDLPTRTIENTFPMSGPWGADFGASPDRAYVAERDSGQVTQIDIAGGFFPVASGLSGPTGIDVNAAETTAYVAEAASGEVSSVNLGGGAVTLIAGALSSPIAVALDPAETSLYVIESGASRLTRVTIAGGATTVVTSSLVNPQGLALDASGTIAYVTEASGGFSSISTVNLTTGAVTPPSFPPGQEFFAHDGLALSPRPPVVMSLPDTAAAPPFFSVAVPVNLDDVTGLGVLSADLRVRFNANVLSATGVSSGSLTGGCTVTGNLTTPGVAVVSVFCTSALSGSGSIASITFSVLGARGQLSPLDITAALLNEGTPAVCADDGRFAVPVDISGVVRYYRDHTTSTEPSSKPVGGANVELSRFDDQENPPIVTPLGVSVTNCVGDYGFGSLTPILSYQVVPRKANDAEGAVDPFDASLNAQHVVGLITLTPRQRLAADASGNGTLTSFDSARIAQFSVGLIAQLPVAVFNGSDWAFFPAPQSEPNLFVADPSPPGAIQGRTEYRPIVESAENQDFLGVLYGDVSGNWQDVTCPLTAPGGVEAASASPVTAGSAVQDLSQGAGLLELPSLKARPGEVIRVPIRASGAGAAVSFYLDLRFDPDVLRLVKVESGAAAAGFSLTSNLGEAGRARLALFHTLPLGGDGEVAVATFEVVGRPGSRSRLELPAYTVNEDRIPTSVKEGSVLVLPARPVR